MGRLQVISGHQLLLCKPWFHVVQCGERDLCDQSEVVPPIKGDCAAVCSAMCLAIERIELRGRQYAPVAQWRCAEPRLAPAAPPRLVLARRLVPGRPVPTRVQRAPAGPRPRVYTRSMPCGRLPAFAGYPSTDAAVRAALLGATCLLPALGRLRGTLDPTVCYRWPS